MVTMLVFKMFNDQKRHKRRKRLLAGQPLEEIIEQINPDVLDENELDHGGVHETAETRKQRVMKRHDMDMLIYNKFNTPLTVKFKIIISYAQIVTVFGQLLPVKYLLEHRQMNQQVDMTVNFDLSSLVWFNCLFDTNYLDMLYMNTLISEILCFFLPVLIYVVAKVVLSRKQKAAKTPEEAQEAKKLLHQIHSNVINFAVTIVLILYPTTSKKIVRYFDCDAYFDDGRQYLRADHSVECYQGANAGPNGAKTWDGTHVYAVVSVVLIPIGIPFVLFILLYRAMHTETLYNYTIKKGHEGKSIRKIGPEFPVPAPRSARMLGSLFIGYEDEVYLFEIWDMIRRLCLTSVWTLIYPSNPELQMCLLLLFLAFCIMLQGWFSPYINESADQLALGLQFCMFLSVFGGIALTVTSADYTMDAFANNENLLLWTTICFFSIVGGYVFGACSLLWELYFGKMLIERTVFNDGKDPEEQMTTREWAAFYNKRMKDRLNEKLHHLHLPHHGKSKVVPMGKVPGDGELTVAGVGGGEGDGEKGLEAKEATPKWM
jgi:hypothetical protein